MALPLALQPCALGLDCADEVACTLSPPPALAAMEQPGLAHADRAQAAGSWLGLLLHGTDAHHFRRSGPVPGSWACAEAALLRPAGPGSQLGHAGVIDERVDLALPPFVDSLVTRHASPIKLLVALTAGLPRAATRLPGITDRRRRAGPAGGVRPAAPPDSAPADSRRTGWPRWPTGC